MVGSGTSAWGHARTGPRHALAEDSTTPPVTHSSREGAGPAPPHGCLGAARPQAGGGAQPWKQAQRHCKAGVIQSQGSTASRGAQQDRRGLSCEGSTK